MPWSMMDLNHSRTNIENYTTNSSKNCRYSVISTDSTVIAKCRDFHLPNLS